MPFFLPIEATNVKGEEETGWKRGRKLKRKTAGKQPERGGGKRVVVARRVAVG